MIKEGVKTRHGQGMYVDGVAEGQTYEGEWQDDAMQGRGIFRYASNAKYEVLLAARSMRASSAHLTVRARLGRICAQLVPWARYLPLPGWLLLRGPVR